MDCLHSDRLLNQDYFLVCKLCGLVLNERYYTTDFIQETTTTLYQYNGRNHRLETFRYRIRELLAVEPTCVPEHIIQSLRHIQVGPGMLLEIRHALKKNRWKDYYPHLHQIASRLGGPMIKVTQDQLALIEREYCHVIGAPVTIKCLCYVVHRILEEVLDIDPYYTIPITAKTMALCNMKWRQIQAFLSSTTPL